jgi:hypothetical protein
MPRGAEAESGDQRVIQRRRQEQPREMNRHQREDEVFRRRRQVDRGLA